MFGTWAAAVTARARNAVARSLRMDVSFMGWVRKGSWFLRYVGHDRQLQASGHLGGGVVHGGVRAAAEAFQQVADSVLHPLPGDFRIGFLRGRRVHQGNVR
jgi:hypothetical protein